MPVSLTTPLLRIRAETERVVSVRVTRAILARGCFPEPEERVVRLAILVPQHKNQRRDRLLVDDAKRGALCAPANVAGAIEWH